MTLLADVLASLPPERRALVDSLAAAYTEIERLRDALRWIEIYSNDPQVVLKARNAIKAD